MDDKNASAKAATRAEYDDLTEIIVTVVLGTGILFLWLLLWSETNLGATLSFLWAVLVSCLLAIATDWVRAVMKP
jgi:sterol desaturase/sphingolipid hydroxylase (fatty acid hydroxylase superfamily)